MHAGPKACSPPTEEEEHQYKQMEEETLGAFLTLYGQRIAGDVSEAALEGTTEILKKIPESYSTYNYRREILFAMMNASPEKMVPILLKELELNTEILKEDFKCYAAFAHRHWIYERFMQSAKEATQETFLASFQMIQKLVKKEQQQCELLLQLDERNFHVWNYRRWVLELDGRAQEEFAHLTGLDVEESVQSSARSSLALSEDHFFTLEEVKDFSFTTKKIKQNFSNYSAWHHRSLVFQRAAARLFSKQEAEEKMDSTGITALNSLYRYLAADVELLCQAVYCDPNDQSAWFYAPFILDMYHQLSEIFSEAYKRGVLHDQHSASQGIAYVNIEPLLQQFEGDLVDVFVFSVLDLMEENLMDTEQQSFLPQSFLLLLFANLVRGRMCSVLEASNHLACSSMLWSPTQMKRTSTERVSQYAEWILSRVNRSDNGGTGQATSLNVRAIHDAVDWLVNFLSRADSGRSGMYRHLASLTREGDSCATSVNVGAK